MKSIHWIMLLVGAFVLGMYVMHLRSELRRIPALASDVSNLNTRVVDIEHRLRQHESRWSLFNRVVDLVRKYLPWC